MYKRFEFEGEVHQSLSCVPLTVRRKLDLAGLKISLEGWQRLSREERLALCHLPVDGAGDLAVYGEVMRGFCAGRDVPLKPLPPDPRDWNQPSLPPALRGRLAELGAAPLDDPAWRALDEESRYGLLKLADPRHDPAKLRAALAELGLGPAPGGDPAAAAACDADPAAGRSA